MDTVLVTGGAGFIGANFVLRTLKQQSVQIVNLDCLSYAGNLDTLAAVAEHPNHIFIQGDIRDSQAVTDLLQQYQPVFIVNFAAESHVDRSIDGPAEFVSTNVVGSLNLLQCALHYWQQLAAEEKSRFRFMHISTDEVYGSLGPQGAFTETTAYAPNSPYAASKAASDHLVRAFYKTYGLPVLTTNCSNNYGPYQFPEKLIPLMILTALSGNPLPVYGDGLQVRDWLFVHDHCDAIWSVLRRGRKGQVYNIGGDSEKTNLEVVESICRLLDVCRPKADGSYLDQITFVTDRPGHDRRYAIDFSKIKNELGWSPGIDFETGLEQTIQWYLDNGPWVERVRDGSYRGQRLGLGLTQRRVNQ